MRRILLGLGVASTLLVGFVVAAAAPGAAPARAGTRTSVTFTLTTFGPTGGGESQRYVVSWWAVALLLAAAIAAAAWFISRRGLPFRRDGGSSH